MTSIKDVAKYAGVSISTVSNVINGTRYVSDELKEKVYEAIDELNYEADLIARSLKSNETQKIGVIVTSINRIFFPNVIKGIQTGANQHNYNLMVYSTEDSFEKEEYFVKMLVNFKVDGIILDTINDRKNTAYFNYLASLEKGKKQIPVVSIERNLGEYGISSVFVSNHLGGKLATEHLLECGARRIACIKGPKFSEMVRDRYIAYREVLKQNGIEFNEEYVFDGDFSPLSGYRGIKEILKNENQIDGLFCCNDQMAIGAIKAIREYGLDIPVDLKIVGYDNTFVSSIVTPQLTTVNVPKYKMGLEAFNILYRLMKNDGIEAEVKELPIELIVRSSTNGVGETDWELENW